MDQVKKLGADEEKKEAAKKKAFILEMVGVAFMVIPFLGEAATYISGLATIARIASLATDISGIALGIEELVRDPEGGLMSLLGIAFGLRGMAQATRDAAGYAKMGAVARNLRTAGAMAKVGGGFKANDEVLQALTGFCKRT
jgi:hypothetical protein